MMRGDALQTPSRLSPYDPSPGTKLAGTQPFQILDHQSQVLQPRQLRTNY